MRVSTVVLISLVAMPTPLLFLAGCATAPSDAKSAAATPTQAARKPAEDDVLKGLQKGMTTAQVRAAWGEPKTIKPMPSPSGQAEVWTYVRTTTGPARQVPTKMNSYTVPNPASGEPMVISDPVYSIEQTEIEHTIELLFFDGKLLEWKHTAKSSSNYSGNG